MSITTEIYTCELCGSSSDEEDMCPACDRCFECCDYMFAAGFYGFDSTDQLD